MTNNSQNATGWTVVVAAVAVAALCVVAPAQIHADDWGARADDDRQAQIVERYRQMLQQDPSTQLALERLVEHVGRGEGLKRLIEDYEGMADEEPDNINIQLILGHLRRERGDYEEAYGHYDGAVELDADRAGGWLGRGTVQLVLGERAAAMEDFEEALEREADRQRRLELLEDLGELAFSQREFDRGIQFYERRIDKDRRDRHVRQDYVQLLVQYRQLDEAIEQYEQLRPLVAGDPREKANLLRDKAEVLETKGEVEEALDAYDEAKGLVRADSWIAREIRGEIVNLYRQDGRLDELLEDYGQRWERGGTDRQMLVADVRAELGQLEEALEVYQRISRADRRATQPRQRAIRVLERLGEDREITEVLQQLVEASPNETRYRIELAEHHIQLGERDEAAEVLEEAGRDFSARPRLLLEIAEEMDRWNFHGDAAEVYERALQRSPEQEGVIIEAGDFFFERGDEQRAVDIWEKLPESMLGETDGMRRQAEVLVERGLIEPGIEVYRQLLEANPDDERLLHSKARALERAQEWADAIEQWQRLLDISKEQRRRHQARSRIVELYEQRRRLDTRLREWRSEAEGESEEARQAALFVAAAHIQTGDYDDAVDVLTDLKTESLSSDQRVTVLNSLERVYLRVGDYDRALEIVSQLKELEEERPEELLERKSDYAVEAGDFDAAVDFATRRLEADPADASAHEHLGDIYRQAGELQEAIEHFETAVDIDPDADAVQFKLGEVLVEQGETARAREALMAVIESGADTQLVRDAGDEMLRMAHQQDRLDALERQWAPLGMRLPVDPEHARLLSNLYDRLAGGLVFEANHGTVQQRQQADEQLYALGGRAATLVVDQLTADDAATVARALRMVTEMQIDAASGQLVRMIGGQHREEVRNFAIVAASRIGSDQLVEPLREMINGGASTRRLLALWALGHNESDRARQTLTEVVRDGDAGLDVAVAALALRHHDPDEEVVEAVAARLAEEDDELEALLILAERVVGVSGDDELRELLEEIAATRSDDAGRLAAVALAGFENEEAARFLWELAAGEDDRAARWGEAGLERMLRPGSLTISWRQEARYFDWTTGEFDPVSLVRDVRRGRVGDRRVDEDSQNVGAVARGLAQLLDEDDGQKGRRLQHRWYENRDTVEDRPLWADDALVDVAEEAVRIAEDPDVEWARRIEAIVEGEWREDEERAGVEQLRDDDPQVRRRALAAVAANYHSGDELDDELREAVKKRLADDDSGVQLAAVRAVAALELTGARDQLRDIEADAPPLLRRSVRQALQVLGDGS